MRPTNGKSTLTPYSRERPPVEEPSSDGEEWILALFALPMFTAIVVYAEPLYAWLRAS